MGEHATARRAIVAAVVSAMFTGAACAAFREDATESADGGVPEAGAYVDAGDGAPNVIPEMGDLCPTRVEEPFCPSGSTRRT
jgi:hypothetical protein